MVKDNGKYVSKYFNISVVLEYNNMLLIDKSELTIASYLSSLDRFFDFMNIESFEDIGKVTTSDIRNFQSFLKENGSQSSTINGYIRPLKAFYNWLLNDEKIESNPFVKVKALKEPKKELSFLSEDEIDMMFNGCKNIEEQTILGIMIALGLRRSELVNLKVSDIEGYEVKIIGKGNKYRSLFLPDDVYGLLKKYLFHRKNRDFEYVFQSKMGSKYSTEAIRQKVKSIARHAGIDESRVEEITPHTMRRTFATNLVEADVNMRVIQGAMGHQNIQTTTKYAKLRNSAVENAMRNQKRLIKNEK